MSASNSMAVEARSTDAQTMSLTVQAPAQQSKNPSEMPFDELVALMAQCVKALSVSRPDNSATFQNSLEMLEHATHQMPAVLQLHKPKNWLGRLPNDVFFRIMEFLAFAPEKVTICTKLLSMNAHSILQMLSVDRDLHSLYPGFKTAALKLSLPIIDSGVLVSAPEKDVNAAAFWSMMTRRITSLAFPYRKTDTPLEVLVQNIASIFPSVKAVRLPRLELNDQAGREFQLLNLESMDLLFCTTAQLGGLRFLAETVKQISFGDRSEYGNIWKVPNFLRLDEDTLDTTICPFDKKVLDQITQFLPRLQSFSCMNRALNRGNRDSAFKAFGQLTNLQQLALNVDGIPITRENIEDLKNLKNLKSLILWTRFSSQKFILEQELLDILLKQFPKLEEICLRPFELMPDQLRHFQHCPQLRSLVVRIQDDFSNSVCSHLSKLPKLERSALLLSPPPVDPSDDVGEASLSYYSHVFAPLSSLTSLHTLRLAKTFDFDLEFFGVGLQKALPNCTVILNNKIMRNEEQEESKKH